MITRPCHVWLLAALLLAVPAAAQEVNLRVEQRVRITAPAAGLTAPTPGTVVGFRGDSVLLQLSAAQVQVPIAAISRIERSHGRSHVVTGLAGALLGGAAGFGAAKIADKDPWTEYRKEPCEVSLECPLEFRFIQVRHSGRAARAPYMGAGLLAGLALGAYIGTERWERVPLYASFQPGERRGELALRLRL